MTPLCVIGSSNTDMVVKSAKIPAPGETVLGGIFFMNAGGKGANQAVAAARLGGTVTLVANVGNDLFGKESIRHFQAETIDTRFVFTDTGLPSGVALINVDQHGENSITVAPGANGNLNPHQIDQALASLPVSSIVLVQLEIPLATVEHAVRQANQAGHRVILNPAPAQKLSSSLLKNIHIITPNENEAGLLTGVEVNSHDSIVQAATMLRAIGVETVIITLGSKGAYVDSKDIKAFVSSPQVTALDTTGAGDCFNGALAVALGENKDLKSAVEFSCMAASRSVTKMGAQQAMPYRKEL